MFFFFKWVFKSSTTWMLTKLVITICEIYFETITKFRFFTPWIGRDIQSWNSHILRVGRPDPDSDQLNEKSSYIGSQLCSFSCIHFTIASCTKLLIQKIELKMQWKFQVMKTFPMLALNSAVGIRKSWPGGKLFVSQCSDTHFPGIWLVVQRVRYLVWLSKQCF